MDRPTRAIVAATVGRLILFAVIAVILGQSRLEAAGFAAPGVGIKARAMGGTFRGLADDWSAIAHNPAGLAFQKQIEVNATLGAFSPQIEYTPAVAGYSPQGDVYDIGFGKANGAIRSPGKDLWPLPTFALVLPSEAKRTTVGGAVFWAHDFNYGWDLFRTPQGYDTDYRFSGKNFATDLDVIDIHPAIARRFGEGFAVGAGLSVLDADLIYRRILPVKNLLGGVFDDYPYNVFYGDFRINGHGQGVGANAGFLWKISDKLNLGVSGQTGATVSLNGTAVLDMAWPFNPSLANLQDQILDSNSVPIYPRTFFRGTSDVQRSARSHSEAPFTMDLNLPAELGLGIGWVASDRLTLAMDLAMTFWSAVDGWDIRIGSAGLDQGLTADTSHAVVFNWDDQVRLSVGADYRARENLALRWGMYYDGAVVEAGSLSPNAPKGRSLSGLTAGFGYTVDGHWDFSAAQEMAFGSSATVGSAGERDGLTVFPGDYSEKRFETLVSASYRF